MNILAISRDCVVNNICKLLVKFHPRASFSIQSIRSRLSLREFIQVTKIRIQNGARPCYKVMQRGRVSRHTHVTKIIYGCAVRLFKAIFYVCWDLDWLISVMLLSRDDWQFSFTSYASVY